MIGLLSLAAFVMKSTFPGETGFEMVTAAGCAEITTFVATTTFGLGTVFPLGTAERADLGINLAHRQLVRALALGLGPNQL